MAVVALDITAFRARYPEFGTAVTDGNLNSLWPEISLYVSNTDASPITDVATRKPILWMVLAHLATINFGVGGEAPSPLVGRIESAAEGTVNFKANAGAPSGSKAWFMQTKYGFNAWQAILPYRSARYTTPTRPASGYVWPW